MTIAEMIPQRVFAAEPAAAAPPAEPAPAAPPPEAAPRPAAEPPAEPPKPNGAAARKWFEDEAISKDEREWLTAKGLATDDPKDALMRALKGYRMGEQKLGKPPENMMDRPGKDQPLAEWMKANAETFGIPDKAEGYEIERPELPEGVEYDEGLEAKVREVAFAHGLPPAALTDLVKAYAEHVGGTVTGLTDELQAASQAMAAELKKDWGEHYNAKVQLARRAVDAVAEQAGFDGKALQNLNMALSEKAGDAAVMRLFATIGEMMGEDSLQGAGRGEATLGTTPAEARAELQRLRAKDGEYAKAYAAGDLATVKRLQPRIDSLTRIAAGG